MHLFLLFLLRFLLLSITIPISYSSPHSHSHSHSHPHLTNASDQHSLLQFKALITYDPQNALTDWNPNTGTFCNWTGVMCSSRRHRVVGLNLPNLGLQGFLSPFLGNLSFLHKLVLFNNSFYGSVPKELGFLRRLTNLSLSNNPLGGSIPAELGHLTKLQFLYLVGNYMAGPIPSSLANISSLIDLELGANNLSGAIPSEFGTFTRLKSLIIRECLVSGSIPSSLANISTLISLTLDSNHIGSAIPPQFGLLTNLRRLYLHQNYVSGPIPSSLSNCTSLQLLALAANDLTGRIPSELGHKLTNLKELYLSINQFIGSIPNSLANCSQLTLLELADNQLSGMVPIQLGKLTLLQLLNLGGNQLVSGSSTLLPVLKNLANCSLLNELLLNNNRLSGALPSAIGQLSINLSVLDLSNNTIGGGIPQQIGNLTNLTFLALYGNLFNGSIPSGFKRLQSLERLYLGNNTLQGSIPSEIGQLQKLGLLGLEKNMLSGSIPDSIGDLQQLRQLDLSKNHLSGKIPATLGKCWRLEWLDLSFNRFTENIPPEVAGLPHLAFYFRLSNNFLQGSLPPQIGKMTMVQAIDISANRLSGIIPITIGSCAGLEYLDLSDNAFEGPIPLSFGGLKSLQDIDLSSNKLSGTIPKSLEKLQMLSHLNFSYNNLTGEIPKGGNFTKFTNASFMGNPRLCGSWIYLPACPNPGLPNHRGHSLLKKVVPIASISVFSLCCFLLGLFWRRKSLHLSKTFALKRELPVISYEELMHATDGFSEANLLGVGSFGSVYKGMLGDGTPIAVKLFNLQNEEQSRSFKKECKVLRRVRHRNLVRVITSCSELHSKALVLQFMSNGSLEKNLYHDGNDCSLSFMDRLNISIDIAHGMQYLHHDCYVQVLHCDLKPSNVLLDDDMTAHITDFGLAQLICPSSEISFTSIHALRGSIGYIAPEYGLGGRVSTKGDVYSYGILLLEMLTRKRPSSDMFVGGLDLRKWVSMAFPDKLVEVVDDSLLRGARDGETEQQNTYKCVSEVVHVGLVCTKESPEERPSMREVVGVLESMRATFVGTPTGAFRLAADIPSLLEGSNNVGALGSHTSSSW